MYEDEKDEIRAVLNRTLDITTLSSSRVALVSAPAVSGRVNVRNSHKICESFMVVELSEGVQNLGKLDFIGDKHLTSFAAFEGAYDSGGFELVHQTTGAVVPDREFPLN